MSLLPVFTIAWVNLVANNWLHKNPGMLQLTNLINGIFEEILVSRSHFGDLTATLMTFRLLIQ